MKKAPIAFALYDEAKIPTNRARRKRERYRRGDRAAKAEAFSKQRVQEGEIAFVEMTKSCARDLTDRIRAGVSDVAEMLHRAHEGRAWVALGYRSWAEYCKAEFEMSSAIYQLLDFVEIKQEIEKSPIVDSPQNESQTRALKSAPADKRAEVWKEAVEAVGGGQVSGTDVEAAGIKVSQSEQAPEISDELRDEVRGTIAAALNDHGRN